MHTSLILASILKLFKWIMSLICVWKLHDSHNNCILMNWFWFDSSTNCAIEGILLPFPTSVWLLVYHYMHKSEDNSINFSWGRSLSVFMFPGMLSFQGEQATSFSESVFMCIFAKTGHKMAMFSNKGQFSPLWLQTVPSHSKALAALPQTSV